MSEGPVTPLERLVRLAAAEALFRLHASKVLIRPLLALATVTLVGATLHKAFGAPPGGSPPAWPESFHVVWNLLFLEHLVELPAHPIGQAVQYLVPLFGVFLLVEGALKLGLTMFRKDENQEDWMTILASTSRDHIVLCGLGNVGYRVLEELVSMGYQVFAIEKDPDAERLPMAQAAGVEVLVADARAAGILEGLNLPAARAVIVATDDDLANLEIAMDARELAPDTQVVLRLFDQRLASKVKQSLGVEVSFSTSQLAAPLLAGAALHPSVVGAHRVDDTVLVVSQLKVPASSPWAGMTAPALAESTRTSVLAVRSHDTGWQAPPPVDLIIGVGDDVQLMVACDRVEEVRASGAPGPRTPLAQRAPPPTQSAC